jgi:hypothetical protein
MEKFKTSLIAHESFNSATDFEMLCYAMSMSTELVEPAAVNLNEELFINWEPG